MDANDCPGCRERDARIAVLEARVAALEAQVRELLARLNTNASNSSIPPSANPPAAPKPVIKTPSGKKTGGQPGHKPHLKQRLPAERVTETIPFFPRHCNRCQTPLPVEARPQDPQPTWHQVIELPSILAQVIEYQGHFRTCPCCGDINHAPIPATIKAHSIGPRLASTLVYLSGAHHVSQRGLEVIARDIFHAPISVGKAAALQAEMSDALASAHAEAVASVQNAPSKNVDETSWKRAGKLCWLWLAATDTVAAFLVHAGRGWAALQKLLGNTIQGIVCSDRWSAYHQLSPRSRQICWAHLKRDFKKLVDRGGLSKPLGEQLLKLAEQVFERWHLFRGGTITRGQLQDQLDPVAEKFESVLEAGRACADAKAATFCENLLGLLPAIWRFVVTDGVEPTNNHAERQLRRGVLWRKNSFGSHSEQGCRFVERMLTVVQTRRLQGRSVLGYLQAALIAHRNAAAAPSLLEIG